MFLLRRVLFIFVVVWMPKFLWGQLALQFACSVTMIIFLLFLRPLESTVDTYREVFNEVCSIVLMYHVLSLSEFLADV